MPAKSTSQLPLTRSEFYLVSVLFMIGVLLRVWNFQEDGLSHFDEGVYAWWGGFGGYPFKELYAPPLFPLVLQSVAYLFGSSDFEFLAVNIVLGTITILVVWRVTRSWYGPRAGVVAASLAALSQYHIQFSQSVLTDILFAVLWLVAMACIPGLIESNRWNRIQILRVLLIGTVTGLTMNTKYHGSMILLVLIVSLLAHNLSTRRSLTTGLVASGAIALIAIACYVPWFLHVENGIGYSRLLDHHRGYYEGFRQWPRNLMLMHRHMVDLSTWKEKLLLVGLMLFFLRERSRSALDVVLTLALVFGVAWFGAGVGVAGGLFILAALLWRCTRENRARFWLNGAWLSFFFFSIPLYRPYARLELPMMIAGWIALAVWIAGHSSETIWPWERDRDSDTSRRWAKAEVKLAALCLVVFGGGMWLSDSLARMSGDGTPRVVTRALRDSANSMNQRLIEEPGYGWVRPSASYYMAGRIKILGDLTAIERGELEVGAVLVIDTALLFDNPEAAQILEGATSAENGGNVMRRILGIPYAPSRVVVLDDSLTHPELREASPRELNDAYQLVYYEVDS